MYNNYLYTILGFIGFSMNKNIVEKKHLSVSIDKSVISKLKTYSAKEGVMQYSSIANNLLSEAYKNVDAIETYAKFKDVFSKELIDFINIKKGRPLEKIKKPKSGITLFLDLTVINNVYRTSKKYQLSISGSVEILLRIVLP